ncbi:hypothetical protein ACET3Z_009780 [Daucus carota]
MEKKMKVKKGWIAVQVGLEEENERPTKFIIPISYLYSPIFQQLLDRAHEMNATVDDTSSDGYVACFDLHSSVVVPKLVFHFENADIELDNYMINDRRSGKWCLAMTIPGN